MQIDISEPQNHSLIDRFHHVWTPDLRILDAEGNDLAHWNGYLPPAEFAAQFLTAVGETRLRRREYREAATLFEEVLKRFPTALVAAEAAYYLAVAHYRASGESRELLSGWHHLESTYPDSAWTVKQNF
jgi:hypothetical protein